MSSQMPCLGEKNVTVSAVRPLLKHILEEVVASTDADCALVKEMKETIADDLQARYISGGISELIDMCSFLDPRFRTRYLENEQETLAKVEREGSEIAEVLHESSQSPEAAPPPLKKLKGLGAILTRVAESAGGQEELPSSPSDRIKREIQLFRDVPAVDPDSDPLLWWASEQKRLPILAELARKYLCICGTSVPSERMFSKSGYLVNDYRSRLAPRNVNMLVFLAKNMS